MQGMGGEQYSSVSVVKPLLQKLLTKSLTPSETDTPVVFEFKRAVFDDLAGCYHSAERKDFFAASKDYITQCQI